MGSSDQTKDKLSSSGWLTGQLLVAMPSMLDPRFEKTVILMCSHGPEGAMGIVVNRLFTEVSLSGLLEQFDMALVSSVADRAIHYGGPVDPVRGFVLHTADYDSAGTTVLSPAIRVTATVEILQALSGGEGPARALVALGYAGWGPGQLEAEIQDNGWLTVAPDEAIVFDDANETKWDRALAKLGVSATTLSGDIGHA